MTGSTYFSTQLNTFSKKFPDKPAVIETTTGNQITYSELIHFLPLLQKRFGSSPKTIVLTLNGGIINSAVWITSLISGHTVIPLSPQLTAHELNDVLKQHTVDIIIADGLAEVEKPIDVITSAELHTILTASKSTESDFQNIKATDGAVLLYTSGSTGIPKRILLSASKVVNTAQNIAKSHRLTSDDRGLTPLPFFHVNAPVVSLITTMVSGGTLIIAPKFSLSNFWKWVEKYNPTWVSLVPTIINLLLKTEKPKFLEKSRLKFIRTASAPLPAITLEQFEKKFDISVIETYGISEGASTVTANPVPPGIHKPGSVGLPIGVELCIAETSGSDLKELPKGEQGEICVKGPNIISAYEGHAGEDSFYDGWFCTGDLGYVDEDGYVYITGRKKDVINRGGEIIAPREIEDILLSYPGISQAIVVGHPDPILGEKVVAMIKVDDYPISEDSVIAYAAEKLSPPKVPAHVYILHDFPKGRTGKIDRNQLKDIKSVASFSASQIKYE